MGLKLQRGFIKKPKFQNNKKQIVIQKETKEKNQNTNEKHVIKKNKISNIIQKDRYVKNDLPDSCKTKIENISNISANTPNILNFSNFKKITNIRNISNIQIILNSNIAHNPHLSKYNTATIKNIPYITNITNVLNSSSEKISKVIIKEEYKEENQFYENLRVEMFKFHYLNLHQNMIEYLKFLNASHTPRFI